MFRNVSKTSNTTNNYSRGGGGSNRFKRGGDNSSSSTRSIGGFNNRRPKFKDPTIQGFFSDGIWLCNCTPRLPAEHFKVKKESPNQGRWFYTCQNSQERRCGFFLWEDDAKPREEAAVLSAKRHEPPRPTTGISRGNLREGRGDNEQSRVAETHLGPRITSQMSTQVGSQASPPPYSPSINNSPATFCRILESSAINNKRSLANTGFEYDDDDDEDYLPWDLSSTEADRLEGRASRAPKTPRKVVKTGVYATPVTTTEKRALPWLHSADAPKPAIDALPETPSKSMGGAISPPTTSHRKPSYAGDGETTPTPCRFRDAVADSPNGPSLAEEVFTLLGSTSLSSDASDRLRAVLNKHELRTRGIVKGREVVRLALKARDAKVAELTAKIASMEADREVDRALSRRSSG